MRPIRTWVPAAVIATALVLAACGNGEQAGEGPEEFASALATTPGATPDPAPTAGPTASEPAAGAGEGLTYEVQPGDTLSAIAAEHATTVQAIVEANDLADPDEIFPGDVLNLPPDAQAP